MCDSLRSMRNWLQTPYQVLLPDASELSGFAYSLGFNVAQYSPRTFELLDAKLKQFPHGTTFVLRPVWGNDKIDSERIEAKMRELFQRRGMILEGSEQNPWIFHPLPGGGSRTLP